MNTQQTTPPLLELKNACVKRAGKEILSINSLVLNEGESVAILGPNGSGKSTLVNLITRETLPLHKNPSAVWFKGKDRATLEEIKKSLGVVSYSQQNQITVHLPAVEIVEGGLFGSLGLNRYTKNSSETRNKALEAMDFLGIRSLANHDMTTLSTGQVRRILIARAFVHNPETMIFDEPCSGLDPEGMYHVRKSMRSLAQSGKGIVLVSHYPEDVIPEIKRVIFLKEGNVFADGKKEDLLADKPLSCLFDTPLKVEKKAFNTQVKSENNQRKDEYFSLVSMY